jgi:hypothetical protein
VVGCNNVGVEWQKWSDQEGQLKMATSEAKS